MTEELRNPVGEGVPPGLGIEYKINKHPYCGTGTGLAITAKQEWERKHWEGEALWDWALPYSCPLCLCPKNLDWGDCAPGDPEALGGRVLLGGPGDCFSHE